MHKLLLLATTLTILGFTTQAQILYPFEFEDELLNDRIGYNRSPSRQIPTGALLDSVQCGEFDGNNWIDEEVIKITRTPDFEILSQSWSNQFGEYAVDTARFLLSGAADSFWIVREEGYFDFGTGQPDTLISSRIGKRWYENGRLDSARLVSVEESSGGISYQQEITHSFTYGPFGLTSFSAVYSDSDDSFVERTDVSYNSNGEKSGYEIFEVDGLDEELEISATITRPTTNEIQYVIDDYGDEFVISQYLSAEGNIDSTVYAFDDGSETFMATLARTDDGTDARFLEYAFISGGVDDPERIRYWLSAPVSGVDQVPLVAGKLQCANPVITGALVRLTDVEPGSRISLVDGNGRMINEQAVTSNEVAFHWPTIPGGIYFLVARRAGHATRAWELIGL